MRNHIQAGEHRLKGLMKEVRETEELEVGSGALLKDNGGRNRLKRDF